MVVERPRDDGRTPGEGTEAVRPSGVEETKAALRHLAGADPESVVDRAAAAVEDLEAAAAFAEDVGVDELARAVESTEDPGVRARGERALTEFRRFRAAAAGDLGPGDHVAGDGAAGHFHPGPGTDLRDGAEGTTE